MLSLHEAKRRMSREEIAKELASMLSSDPGLFGEVMSELAVMEKWNNNKVNTAVAAYDKAVYRWEPVGDINPLEHGCGAIVWREEGSNPELWYWGYTESSWDNERPTEYDVFIIEADECEEIAGEVEINIHHYARHSGFEEEEVLSALRGEDMEAALRMLQVVIQQDGIHRWCGDFTRYSREGLELILGGE